MKEIILVVDDEKPIVDVIKSYLEMLGIQSCAPLMVETL